MNANKKQRTGTFLCWMFGHKFIQETRKDEIIEGKRIITYLPILIFACIRCGINRET